MGEKIVNGSHVAVVYNVKEERFVFTKYADEGTIRIVNALQKTSTGTQMLLMAVNSPTKVQFYLSDKVNIHINDGQKKYIYGECLGGNYNKKDNYGKTEGTSGYYKNKAYYKQAKITIYKGTIEEDAKTDNPKHANVSIDDAIGAVAGHELVHAVDPNEVDKDIRYEKDKGRLRPGQEKKPNEIENKILRESQPNI